jgi:hypothetical protein
MVNIVENLSDKLFFGRVPSKGTLFELKEK